MASTINTFCQAHPLSSPAKGIWKSPHADKICQYEHFLDGPNLILPGYGYSFVNVTILTSFYLEIFRVPFQVQEITWYRVKTVLSGTQCLTVSIEDTQIFSVSLTGYYVDGSTIPTRRSFGIGGWQDQSGIFKDVYGLRQRQQNGTLQQSNDGHKQSGCRIWRA